MTYTKKEFEDKIIYEEIDDMIMRRVITYYKKEKKKVCELKNKKMVFSTGPDCLTLFHKSKPCNKKITKEEFEKVWDEN